MRIDYEKSFRFYMLISGGTDIDGAREDGYVKDADDEKLWNIVLADPDAYSQPVRETCGAVFNQEVSDAVDRYWAEKEAEALEKAAFASRSEAARYAAQQRWKNNVKKQPAAKAPAKAEVTTADPKEALDALQAGKTVSLTSVEGVNTLIKEVHDFAQKSKKDGKKVKLNLCQVSVPGTNLFCGAALKDDAGKPIPRDKMPQLAGTPKKGSPADNDKKFPKDSEGEVNVGDAFVKYLSGKGIETKEGDVPASSLKASQSELKGKTIGFMMSKKGQTTVDLENTSIFVSSDGYVIDGHHRWAAKVGLDSKDGKLGDKKIRVRVINMPIKQVLTEANAFTSALGIEPKQA